jgi:site-specific DNA recombinase
VRSTPAATRPVLRCALYTRVSTEHGLEQEFNSLDNQREAGEAYVRSQAHEGWTCLPIRYDDGGYSGGSLDRPALARLVADIRERQVDIVVVYKVDRLTRSLADFAKLVELFDTHGVSFVSVTQSFNTTSSMGRLTLNVLLSFAQFEREVTGERIRDKIAASKRKGLWMGGVVPLGYRVQDRKLLVEEREAQTVRLIFERYLALRSLPALQRELRGAGVTSRARTLASGRTVEGGAFTNGPLAHLLRNRVYLGEIKHKGHSYKGEHPVIVAPELFQAVQDTLAHNLNGRRHRRTSSGALLLGRLEDDRGNRMTPSTAVKNGVRYRYYVSCTLAQGRRAEAGSVHRVSAPDLEAVVCAALRQSINEITAGDRPKPEIGEDDRDLVHRLLHRAVVRKASITLELNQVALPGASPVEVAWSPPVTRRRRVILDPASPSAATSLATSSSPRPIRAESRTKLIEAIAQGRTWLDEIVSGDVTSEAIAERQGVSERQVRLTLSLAFLAPELIRAAIEGTLPRGAGLSRMTEMPAEWALQWAGVAAGAA